MIDERKTVTRSGFIALIGRPNVGKSTLLNHLMGEKIAIVSPKPQTTRSRILGVLTEEDYQMVFIDTPGVHRPRTKLGEYMADSVKRTINDVDIAVIVVDATDKFSESEKQIVDDIKKSKLTTVLVINKIDAIADKTMLIKRISELSMLCEFEAVVPLSALTGDGVSILKDELITKLPDGPAFFPEDTLTDQTERVLVSELIREKLLYMLDDELPHGIGVIVEQMKERDNVDIIDIDATIYCEKDSHKGMIIGKGGAMLKRVGMLARADIEKFLDCKTNLKLWVKVKLDWRNKEGSICEMGYVRKKAD